MHLLDVFGGWIASVPYNLSALSCCDERQVEQMSPEEFDGHQVKGSELIRDYLVGAFEDCIGLRVRCGRNYCLDSVGLKEFLKELNSCEFGSFVVKTNKRSWVVTEPGAIKGTSHSAAFCIGNNNQLEQVSAQINHS